MKSVKLFSRCVIHVGMDKTGTTAIQTSFDSNREYFFHNLSIYYPFGRWHAEMGSCFSGDPTRYVHNVNLGLSSLREIRARDKAYLERLESDLLNSRGGETLFVSYEGFMGMDAPSLRRMKSYLQSFADKICVLMYVRPCFSYVFSALSQRAKQGQGVKYHYPNLIRVLSNLEEVFHERDIALRVYDKAELIGGDVVLDELEFLTPRRVKETCPTMAMTPMGDLRQSNKSTTWPAVAFSDELVKELAHQDCHLSVAEFGGLIGGNLSHVSGPKIGIDDESAHRIAEICKTQSDYLEKKYGVSVMDSPPEGSVLEKNAPVPEWEGIVRSLAKPVAGLIKRTLSVNSDFSKKEFAGRVGLANPNSVPENISVGQEFTISVYVENLSDRRWIIDPEIGPHLSYHWERKGDRIVHDGLRTALSTAAIEINSPHRQDMIIASPARPGTYQLCLTAVQEGYAWLEDLGLIYTSLVLNVDQIN